MAEYTLDAEYDSEESGEIFQKIIDAAPGQIEDSNDPSVYLVG